MDHIEYANDQDLVEHCLAGEPVAWIQLDRYRRGLERYAHWLQNGRDILGFSPEGTVQQMFCHLCHQDYHLLRAYQPQRGPLHAYLGELVRQQVRRLRGRAHRRVTTVPLADYDRVDVGASGGVAEAELHECVATLSAAEHRLLAEAMRPRYATEERRPAAPRDRKAKQRLRMKIRGGLG